MSDNLRILLIGPLPPPVGGGAVTFQIFCEKLKECTQIEHIEIINSSASYFKPKSQIIAKESVIRALSIVRRLARKVRNGDIVIIFGTNGFVFSLVPFLLIVTKVARAKCYVRVFGGSFDQYHHNLPYFFRYTLNITLTHLNGLIVQTQTLYDYFAPLIGDKVYLMPQYRNINENEGFKRSSNYTIALRLVFLSHVKRTKGVFILLNSLKEITQAHEQIYCDFYGPISEEDKENFWRMLGQLNRVNYKGILPAKNVISRLREYDVLVLPTYYPNEGHPGVIVEAIIAGIPIIATNFRSIPDLVQDSVNGLLVKPDDVDDLSCAILKLYHNRKLLNYLAGNNFEKRKKFNANYVIPHILKMLGVPVKPTYISDHE